jgi:hypothetical protein
MGFAIALTTHPEQPFLLVNESCTAVAVKITRVGGLWVRWLKACADHWFF